MSVKTGYAGENIRRGDMIKIVDEKLFPALLFERNVGVAIEDIAEGTHAYCLQDGLWRTMLVGFRP